MITVSNEPEAEMVCDRLSAAGIRSLQQLSSDGVRLGAAAGRDVMVEEGDLDCALEVLNSEVPSDEELAAMSQAAVHPPDSEDDAAAS